MSVRFSGLLLILAVLVFCLYGLSLLGSLGRFELLAWAIVTVATMTGYAVLTRDSQRP